MTGRRNLTRLNLIITEAMNSYSVAFFSNQERVSPAWANLGIVLLLLGWEELWKMSELPGSWKTLGHYLHTTLS